ncbi:MAG: type II toxin-antitoxin system HicA family toxin [Planctomycetia bacterium]
MRSREVATRLTALGCSELPRRGAGSHRKWWNPAAQRGADVPDWGGKDLKPGTVRAEVRQWGLDWQAFQGA